MHARLDAWLFPTPRERMLDAEGRPYFLWDADMTLAEFEVFLHDPDPEIRGYAVAKVMRQARPDDVFAFVDLDTIESLWPIIDRYLGKRRDFWTWLLGRWRDCAA